MWVQTIVMLPVLQYLSIETDVCLQPTVTEKCQQFLIYPYFSACMATEYKFQLCMEFDLRLKQHVQIKIMATASLIYTFSGCTKNHNKIQ